MPWNECKPMDERLRFVARLLEGEKMAPPRSGINQCPAIPTPPPLKSTTRA